MTNVGKGLATASMCVKDNGTDRWLYEFGKSGKERVVGLNPGESVTLSAPLTLSALGTHTLKLDSYTKTVNVTFRKATYAYSNLRLQLGSGTVSEPTSDVIYAKADVQNIGNEAQPLPRRRLRSRQARPARLSLPTRHRQAAAIPSRSATRQRRPLLCSAPFRAPRS